MTSTTRVLVAAAAMGTLLGATGGLATILGAAIWGMKPGSPIVIGTGLTGNQSVEPYNKRDYD